ncbi:MAG: PRD domain-containing protein [Halanaerobiales bacterium]|nr:PRD domain-containing protein [Halanaerobiales bacterium]
MDEIKKIRHKKLIYELLNSTQYLTTARIANKLNVSKRTIRRDLDRLKNYFKTNGAKLITKPNKGIYLKVVQETRIKLKEKTFDYESNEVFSFQKRHDLIIHKLFCEEYFKKEGLLELFNISESTFYNDLTKGRDTFDQYNLKLKISSNGKITINGSELYKRILITNTLLNLVDEEDKKDIIYLLENNINLRVYGNKYIKKHCIDIDFKKIRSFIKSIENELGVIFNSNSILYLVFYTAVGINRINKNHNIKTAPQDIIDLKTYPNHNFIKEITKKAVNEFYIKLNEYEIIAYILQIWSLRSHKINYNALSLEKVIKPQITETAQIIMKKFKENILIKIEDKKLFKELALFIRSIFVRYQYDIYSFNNINISEVEIERIKRNNPFVFGLANSFKKIIEENLQIKIKESEVMYIGLLFLSAVEMNKVNLKTLLIYNNSIPVARIMINRLENKFPNLDLSCYYFNKLEIEIVKQFDLVISSRYFEKLPHAVVISPLVTIEDTKRIKDKINVVTDIKRLT